MTAVFERRRVLSDVRSSLGDMLHAVVRCASFPKEHTMVKLVSYEEAPAHLQHNRFIREGYRAYLDYRGCVRSLFRWSNELVNIWSHIFGFIWASYVLISSNMHMFGPLEEAGASQAHRVVTSLFLVCVQFCMICSALYHLFNCHSATVAHHWLKRDFLGISVGIMGCYFPGIYYGFYCFPDWLEFYMKISVLLSIISVGIQLHPEFSSERWKRRRMLTYAGILLFGFVPLMHWGMLNNENHDELEYFIPKVLTSYGIIAAGFVFYVSFMPECCAPGNFDYVGHSHQWWHILVLSGFVYWYRTGLVLMNRRLQPESCTGVHELEPIAVFQG